MRYPITLVVADVRYRVILTARTLGSSLASLRNRSTEVSKDW
jgi:hypothetical protein